MSYSKAMFHCKSHKKNKCHQPILGMPFEGLKEGQHIESYHSRAIRIATSYNIRVSDVYKGAEFKQISQEFKTEAEAIDYVLEYIKQFGIKLSSEIEEMKELGFALYRDEEEEQPEEVLQIIKIEAECRNWKYYVEI